MKYNFRVNSGLLIHLGDQLIKNEVIALTELIKNAYDADASFVKVEFYDISDTKKQDERIVIEDDGSGMDINIIQKNWLEIGNSTKKEDIKNNKKSPIYQRLPLGEKGIGRLGVHKLGREIEMITRASNSQEIVVKINWNDLNNNEDIEDFPIKIIEREPNYFKNKTGTKIIIRNLKNNWTEAKIKKIHNELMSLKNPFNDMQDFNFSLNINNKKWLDEVETLDGVLEKAIFYYNVKISDNGVERFDYKFMPPKSLKDRIEGKALSKDDEIIKGLIESYPKRIVSGLGEVEFTGYIFDLDSNLSDYILGAKSLRDYLKNNSGIKVYRDGLRIYNYGEEGDDWLNLNQRRINRLSIGINKKLLIGVVNLKRESSKALKEKSNREGFIENEAFETLKNELLDIMGSIEYLRQIDRTALYTTIGKYQKSVEPLLNELEELNKIVEEKIENEDVKKEIKNCLFRVEKDYHELKEIFMTSASTGLNMSMFFHEIEKSVDFLSNAIIDEESIDSVKQFIKDFVKVIEDTTYLIRKGDKETDKIGIILTQILRGLKIRSKRHKFEVEIDTGDLENITINCPRRILIGMLYNIIGNAVDWFKISNKQNAKLLIKINKEGEFTSIIVADNGPGFKIAPNNAKQLFTTTKPRGQGIGLGLFIVDSLMEKNNGLLLINDLKTKENLPIEYKTAVELKFKED